MESFPAWLSLCVSVLLAVECVLLHLDGKGQRRALDATRAALAALQAQVAGLAVAPTVEAPPSAQRTRAPAPPGSLLDAHSARAGVKAAHCDGDVDTICECPCETCSRRRALLERAIVDVLGPQSGAEFAALRVLHAGQGAALAGRVLTRHRSAERVAPRGHCGGAGCVVASCACPCEACRAGWSRRNARSS